MEQFIGCDAHKKFLLFVAMNEDGEYGPAIRVGHDREVFRQARKSRWKPAEVTTGWWRRWNGRAIGRSWRMR